MAFQWTIKLTNEYLFFLAFCTKKTTFQLCWNVITGKCLDIIISLESINVLWLILTGCPPIREIVQLDGSSSLLLFPPFGSSTKPSKTILNINITAIICNHQLVSFEKYHFTRTHSIEWKKKERIVVWIDTIEPYCWFSTKNQFRLQITYTQARSRGKKRNHCEQTRTERSKLIIWFTRLND